MNLIAATLGTWFAAKLFGETLLAPMIGKEDFVAYGLKPPYPLFVAFGILTGYIARIRWKGPQALWVWIPTAVYFASGLLVWLHTGFHIGDALNHFFGLECYPLCQDQYERTVPLYTSLAYSFGALSNHRRSASNGKPLS
ncbi:MAG: hypothetical protein ACRD3L_14200 [Terriglobales bacterium]